MYYFNIEYILMEKGKSKYYLVKELPTSYTVINKMIAQQMTGVKFETLHKICKLLDCRPNDLLVEKREYQKCKKIVDKRKNI